MTKPHSVATSNLSASLFHEIRLTTCFISRPSFIVAVGLSVCEHFRHILVSPTCKLPTTDICQTYPYISIYGAFRFQFKNALNTKFIHGRRWMNIIKVSSDGGKTDRETEWTVRNTYGSATSCNKDRNKLQCCLSRGSALTGRLLTSLVFAMPYIENQRHFQLLSYIRLKKERKTADTWIEKLC